MPLGLLGSDSINTTYLGIIKISTFLLQYLNTSFSVINEPGVLTINAFIACPSISSGKPITAASLIPSAEHKIFGPWRGY